MDSVRALCLSVEPTDDFRSKSAKTLCHEGTAQESLTLCIVRRRVARYDLIQVHRELCRVERMSMTKILVRPANLVPGFKSHDASPRRLSCLHGYRVRIAPR